VPVHKILSLDQNGHFQGLRFKINVEFTSVNDHLFYEHNEKNGHYEQTQITQHNQWKGNRSID